MSSPPPDAQPLVPPPSKKRKRPPPPAATASSPAPSDAASPTNDSLVTRGDLSSRPILTISRGPIFIPCNEALPDYYKTDLVGVNRVGFRYVPAGINPPGHATPCRTIESNPTSYRISWEDRSPFIKVTKDGLGLAGSTGFRSARCNAPMREGKWYLEVRIVHGGGEHVHVNGNVDDSTNGSGPAKVKGEGAHVRLGWGRREATLNGPVGLDGYSYGYRDKTGEKVTLSRPRPYGKSFGTGDVIGMYISLPPRHIPNPKDPHDPAHIRRERIPIDLKGQEVFEILEYPQSKEMSSLMDYSSKSTQSTSVPSTTNKKAGPNTGKPPDTIPDGSPTKAQTKAMRPLPTLGEESKIAFFVNGECQGIAFKDLYDYLQLRQPKDKIQKGRERRKAKEGVKEHRENPFDDGWLGYYPFISLFNDACVHINPGPDFDFPPPPDVDALLEGRDPLVPSKPDNENEMYEDVDSKPMRTWRPACERYSEFIQEQWALDAMEEEEASAEQNKMAETNKKEEEKAEQRRKKRREAEVKRKAKKMAELEARKKDGVSLPPAVSGMGVFSVLPGSVSAGYISSNYPSPSPLRHSTTVDGGDLEQEFESAITESGRNSVLGDRGEYESERGRSVTTEPLDAALSHLQRQDQEEEEEEETTTQLVPTYERGEIELPGRESSPAPTATSYAGHGGSEYASDFHEEHEGEIEEEEEGDIDEQRKRPRREFVREEEEEEEEEER